MSWYKAFIKIIIKMNYSPSSAAGNTLGDEFTLVAFEKDVIKPFAT